MVTLGQRYELIRPLAEGGMAALWLAKLTGTAGFAKLVVLKRILPQLARADRFASMFLDEGRVAADLRHPNIVQVLEAGSDGGELFISMELLEGLDAGKLMSRTLARGERLPVAVAVQIVVDAAAGLAYAHQKRSLDGEPLEIVHRDISPQNLFVTVDGHTKVVDFGIAKARSQTTMTEVGTLKGKCAYMAPEQVCGDPVDHRADQFALGVVMWELLAAQRLFRRETDVDTLRAVLRHEVPPLRDVVDGIPSGLGDIVKRTLATDPEDRFPDCGALVDALDEFIDSHVDGERIRRGPRVVARVVRERMADPPPAAAEVEEKTLPQRIPIGRSGLSSDDTGSESLRFSGPPPTLAPAPVLIGRDAERRAIFAALDDANGPGGANGPVVLVGPEGVGKSHLARSILEELQDSGRASGGTYVVELAGAETGGDVVTLLGFALGLSPDALPEDALPEDIGRVAALAGRALSARGRAAVLLDGVDEIVAAAAPLARELAAHTHVIVTAKAPLEVMGERLVDVRPLELPVAGAPHALVLQSPSVRLLAVAAGVDLGRLSAEEAASWADVARSSGGTPASLLLAGRWLGEQSAARPLAHEVARRAGERPLDVLLEGGLARLDHDDRGLVLRLALHRGPLDELLVQHLVPEHAPGDVLARLRRSGAVVGHEMAPATRDKAVDELAARGELKDARARHAAALAAVAKREVERLDEAGADEQDRILGVLEALCPAVEDALEGLLSYKELDDEDDARLLWLSLALDALVTRRGASAAHLRLLDEALAHASPRMDRALRARALEARADHEKVAGRIPEARRDYLAALELAGDNLALQALLHRNVADLELDVGELVSAELHARRSVAAARRAGNARLLARATWTLARLAFKRGNVAEAEILLERAGAAFEEGGDKRFAARVIFELGRCSEARGDASAARVLFARALVEHEAEHDLVFAGRARLHLGVVTAWLGDAEDALHHLRRARDDARARGDLRAEASALGHLADLEAARGDSHAARRFRQEAAALT